MTRRGPSKAYRDRRQRALTYSLSPALPLGLSFDPATQTIWGLPLGAIIEVQKILLLK
ncbi:MAG: hypothetical protein OXI72_04475 [Gemmatimonadota bacterium]|nr:hypothetical protein [Gemmatimonadota bacterium]